MNPHTPKWAPFWELESQWTFEFFGNDYRGQNSLDWKVLYNIRKLLELRCLKGGSHIPFEYLKHKLWLKEGSRIKLPIWFLTTKSEESPRYNCMKLTCHILLERSRWRLQLYFKFHLNRRFAQNVMGLQKICLDCHMSPYNWCEKWTCVKWSMNIPWCATCHHLSGKNFNDWD